MSLYRRERYDLAAPHLRDITAQSCQTASQSSPRTPTLPFIAGRRVFSLLLVSISVRSIQHTRLPHSLWVSDLAGLLQLDCLLCSVTSFCLVISLPEVVLSDFVALVCVMV